MRDYVSVVDVLAIHSDLIDRYGGSHGVRDYGLLEAAIFRPQSGYYQDIIAEAAALWHSLSQNHPFIDGNKRVAFAATYTFLVINGIDIVVDADQIWEFLHNNYEEGTMTFERLDGWLRLYTATQK